MRCYERVIAEGEASIATLEANPDLDPVFRTRQVANFRAQIDSDRSQQYAAAFNAANHFARGGQIPKARVLIEVAARDPGLADRIAALRKMIGGT
jgi:hypothetical protein